MRQRRADAAVSLSRLSLPPGVLQLTLGARAQDAPHQGGRHEPRAVAVPCGRRPRLQPVPRAAAGVDAGAAALPGTPSTVLVLETQTRKRIGRLQTTLETSSTRI